MANQAQSTGGEAGGGGAGTVKSVNSGVSITVDNTDPANPIVNFTGSVVAPITVVANYSALPAPATVSGKFYWCSASQGTKWLPGSLGGTYYDSGLYYSNGASWEYMDVPYQATQAEVNTGTNTDKFVTPSTLANYTGLTSKVASVTGTANRITSTGGTTPVIDLSASYVGQSSLTTLGTIGTGTWNGSIITGAYGGTGVNNGSFTIALAGNLATTGAFNTTFAQGFTGTITLPTATATLYSTQSSSFSSAQLATSLSDKTGTGVSVFSAAPTLTGVTIVDAISTNKQVYQGALTTSTPSGTTQTINWDNGNLQVLSLASASGTVTVTLTNPQITAYTLKIIQNGTTARTIVWPAAVKWTNGLTPTITTTLNAVDSVSLFYDGTNYYATWTPAYS